LDYPSVYAETKYCAIVVDLRDEEALEARQTWLAFGAIAEVELRPNDFVEAFKHEVDFAPEH